MKQKHNKEKFSYLKGYDHDNRKQSKVEGGKQNKVFFLEIVVLKGRSINGLWGINEVLGRVWEKRQIKDVMEEVLVKERVTRRLLFSKCERRRKNICFKPERHFGWITTEVERKFCKKLSWKEESR